MNSLCLMSVKFINLQRISNDSHTMISFRMNFNLEKIFRNDENRVFEKTI